MRELYKVYHCGSCKWFSQCRRQHKVKDGSQACDEYERNTKVRRLCTKSHLERKLGVAKYAIEKAAQEDLITYSNNAAGQPRIDLDAANTQQWLETQTADVQDHIQEFLSKFLPEQFIKLSEKDVKHISELFRLYKQKIDAEQNRAWYIDRELVQQFFYELVTIDESIIKPIGYSLSDRIAGICGTTDPEAILEVQKAIDDVVYKALTQRKKRIEEWLETQNSESTQQ